jgi:hypothetical protein
LTLSERNHLHQTARGLKPWQDAFGPAGAVQAKVTDATLARRMALEAALGHSCGMHFRAKPFLDQHPEFTWQKPLLRDLPAHPWTPFEAAG